MQNNTIWQQLIQNYIQQPINWLELEEEYEIKKLELQKLHPKEIREKKLQFERKYQKEHQISKSWMENQLRLFIWFLFTYSKIVGLSIDFFGSIQWNTVSECFCKEPLICKYFYLTLKKIKSPQWTKDEDDFIQKMMRTDLNKKWTQIGLQLFKCSDGTLFQKPKSIRERWLSHLNPQIKRNVWDLVQDIQLIKYIKEIGRKWSKIAKLFGNRTEHTIKNRYHQLISKYQKQATSIKIDFKSLTEDQKIYLIEKKLFKYQKNLQARSLQTLPQRKNHQIKTSQEQASLNKLRIFQPIILSMKIQSQRIQKI